MAHSYQMSGGYQAALMIVGGDETEVGIVVISVHKYNRQVVVVYAFDQRAVGAARHCNDSVDSS